MDDATEELYLQKIEEFVHDDDLIVTTEFLCRKLNIAIKDAKHLIGKYLIDHRNVNPNELGVHYAILGKLCKSDTFCVLLVSEVELSERLSLFNKSGYSKEIYSIQKAINSDITALNLLNPEPRENALLGSIVGKNCLATKKVICKSVPMEPSKRKLDTIKVEKMNIPVEKKSKLVDENIIGKKTSPCKTKIANRSVPNSKGIASLFSKMAENHPKIADKKPPVEENVEKLEENEPISKQSKSLSKLIDTDNESDEEVRLITEPSKKEARISNSKQKTPKSSTKLNKKRNRKDETPEKSQKRRKRVIKPQSESDDDIFGKSDEEDAGSDRSWDEAPPQQPIFKPQQFDPSAPKNKQKKFVNKSYVDGDGYMVTKREWVAVSGSEDEEPHREQEATNVPLSKPMTKKIADKQIKKPIDDKRELPTSTAAKGKGKNAKKATNQPSILSFFNKK